jgi:hypothetical protein
VFWRKSLPADFDPAIYLELHNDVRLGGMDPAKHYRKFGMEEGRRYRHESESDETGFWDKARLCGLLSIKFNLKRYLEITTTTTGFKYPEIAKLEFQNRKRLVYRLNTEMSDGLPVDYSTEGDDITQCFDILQRDGHSFDLIFVDPHHTYECSYRDISEAFNLLEPGGAMVVHDCRPPSEETATPEFKPGSWCGVTYKAFVDFVLANPRLHYFTFNVDFGCGVILKPKTIAQRFKCRTRAKRDQALKRQWKRNSQDPKEAYRNFKANEFALLRLVDFAGLREKLNS